MPKFLRRKPRTVRDILEDLGMSDAEIAAAEATGTDELLATELQRRGWIVVEP